MRLQAHAEQRGAGEVAVAADGSVEAKFLPTRSGPGQVAVTRWGEHILGSPFETSIAPGEVVSGCSTVSGEGVHTATAGKPTQFGITTRDTYGNASTAHEPPVVQPPSC